MGAPIPEMEPVENASAEALLSSLPTVSAVERRKHATVFNYWHSIRGDRQFPPIRDLDPLEVSDAGPCSILLEMIGGGDDAIVRHLGQALKSGQALEKVGEAPIPSLLSCIHAKLPIVAACRQAFAFEETFEADDGPRRCWVSLLPFSENGTWIDYVYGFVSLDPGADDETNASADEPDAVVESEAIAEEDVDPFAIPLRPFFDDGEPTSAAADPVESAAEETEAQPELETELVPAPDAELEPAPEPELVAAEPEIEPEAVDPPLEAVSEFQPDPQADAEAEPAAADQIAATKPGFSAKLFEKLGNVAGFYGQGVEAPPLTAAEFAVENERAAENELTADAVPTAEPEADAEANSETEAAAEVEVEREIVAEAKAVEPTSEMEGTLQNKLSEVRAMAEEARLARLRSVAALVEGLSAAYDFAVDAEQAPEEYLKLVEAQGLKIQLRAPMKPVVKLAFDESWDHETIAELEAVLAWALKMELPRGSLAERIEAEGGLGTILEGLGRAA